MLENVAALLSRGLDRVAGDLAEIGYDCEWHCIPASAVGAPHRRDRIWVVAYPDPHLPRLEGRLRRGLQECADERAAWQTGALANTESEGARDVSKNQRATSGEISPFNNTCRSGRGDDKPQHGQNVCDPNNKGEPGGAVNGKQGTGMSQYAVWEFEPDVGRVANGIPSRVDRLKGLGNAIVPQVAYLLFQAIEENPT